MAVECHTCVLRFSDRRPVEAQPSRSLSLSWYASRRCQNSDSKILCGNVSYGFLDLLRCHVAVLVLAKTVRKRCVCYHTEVGPPQRFGILRHNAVPPAVTAAMGVVFGMRTCAIGASLRLFAQSCMCNSLSPLCVIADCGCETWRRTLTKRHTSCVNT